MRMYMSEQFRDRQDIGLVEYSNTTGLRWTTSKYRGIPQELKRDKDIWDQEGLTNLYISPLTADRSPRDLKRRGIHVESSEGYLVAGMTANI